MAKVGELGVAVFDCLRAGVCPSALVGRVELGSPTLYRVKKVRREVGELVATDAMPTPAQSQLEAPRPIRSMTSRSPKELLDHQTLAVDHKLVETK